jgi:hypothetical protein
MAVDEIHSLHSNSISLLATLADILSINPEILAANIGNVFGQPVESAVPYF